MKQIETKPSPPLSSKLSDVGVKKPLTTRSFLTHLHGKKLSEIAPSRASMGAPSSGESKIAPTSVPLEASGDRVSLVASPGQENSGEIEDPKPSEIERKPNPLMPEKYDPFGLSDELFNEGSDEDSSSGIESINGEILDDEGKEERSEITPHRPPLNPSKEASVDRVSLYSSPEPNESSEPSETEQLMEFARELSGIRVPKQLSGEWNQLQAKLVGEIQSSIKDLNSLLALGKGMKRRGEITHTPANKIQVEEVEEPEGEENMITKNIHPVNTFSNVALARLAGNAVGSHQDE